MKRKEKWIAVIICLVVAFGLAACGSGTKTADKDSDQTAGSTQTLQESSDSQDKNQATTEKATKETTKKEQESKSSKAESSKNKAKTSKKEDLAKKSTKSTKGKSAKDKKPSGHVLTMKKDGKEVYFTEKDLAGMGKVTYKYSYRNKESSQRQFLKCSGVKFSTLLSKSTFSGSKARFHSTDGYTKEFSISELKSTKKAFLKTKGSTAKDVPAIIALGSAESFRLCFGQAADDADDNGDYNAQYWVKWIDTIEIF